MTPAKPMTQEEGKMHVYRNEVVEWFVAASPEDARAVANEYYDACFGFGLVDSEERDLDLTQEPDDKVLSIYCEDAPTEDAANRKQTCAEWAAENGRGFLCPRQISEVYKSVGRDVTMKDTQNARLYRECKDAMAILLRPGGVAITCGWNSGGFGKGRGFTLREVLLVPCGAAHNDYIVTVETKNEQPVEDRSAEMGGNLPLLFRDRTAVSGDVL